MTQTMRAVVADGHGGVELDERPVPRSREGWVVIAPVGTGVCGTDLHLIDGDYPHGRFPVVPGHEFAGYVTEVGPGVGGLAEGDYVGVNPNISCTVCVWCRRGAPNLCVDLLPVGVAVDGSCAEYVAVPSRTVVPLSASIEHRAAPLIEPFACVLHALERAPGWRGEQAGRSISIPTWFYGHEPTNVFGTAIAKYFANALREDTLLHRCRGGIVFAPGAAGTVQEIFQAANDRFYGLRGSTGAPLVLLGREHWTTTLPAWPPLQALARDSPMAGAVHVVDDLDEALALVTA
jgi:hypothetical protein